MQHGEFLPDIKSMILDLRQAGLSQAVIADELAKILGRRVKQSQVFKYAHGAEPRYSIGRAIEILHQRECVRR